MTTLSIRTFSGEVPRLPADRLPDGCAQFAQNCDFTHGVLRPLAGLGPHYLTGEGAQPCRALFTADGEKFFAWDKPTRAFLAPTIDDVWGRVYYNTEDAGLKVSQRSAMYDKTAQPRPPAAGSRWNVGVTRPNGLTSVVSTDLALDVYVQTLKYGVMVEEVPVVSTTTVTPGVTYDVVIPPGALTTETTTTESAEGVSIRRALRHGVEAEIAVRAAAILHQHRLPEGLAHPLRDRTRDEVGPATRREADDEANGALRKGLREGGGGQQGRGQQRAA